MNKLSYFLELESCLLVNLSAQVQLLKLFYVDVHYDTSTVQNVFFDWFSDDTGWT